VGGVWLVTVALTLAAKMAVGRPDTGGFTDNLGGSFPSGHTISVIVCFGLAVLVLQPRASWWLWLIPALLGCVMGASLVIQSAHWVTDVLGAGLLATGVLIAVSASGWCQWSQRRQRPVEKKGRSIRSVAGKDVSANTAGSILPSPRPIPKHTQRESRVASAVPPDCKRLSPLQVVRSVPQSRKLAKGPPDSFM